MATTYGGIPLHPRPIPSIKELNAIEAALFAPNLPMSPVVFVCNRHWPHSFCKAKGYRAREYNGKWIPAALVSD